MTTQPENKSAARNMLEVSEVINNMLELHELLTKENIYLKSSDMAGVKEIHDTKINLIRKLELQQKIIKKDPSLLGAFSLEQKTFIQKLQDQLDKVTKENFTETLKAKELNKKLVSIISGAIERQTSNLNCYNGLGRSHYDTNSQNMSVDSNYAMTINTSA